MKEAAAAAAAAAPALRPSRLGTPDLDAMVTDALAGGVEGAPAGISTSLIVNAAISALAHQS
ncbi:hypothetical protein [Variovorax defluvii]